MPAHHHSLQVRSPLKIEIKTNKYIAQRKQTMKIVFLDSKTIGDDIDLSEYDKLGEVVKYDFSTTEEAAERTRDADVIVLNKVEVNEKSIGQAKNLKLVCVTATGTNNLDKEYLAKRGIEWRNVAGYSTETVAQHTFALLFYLLEKLRYYDDYVKSEKYVGDTSFTHFSNVFHQISGMTWGIVGLGNIGRRVADIVSVHAPLTDDTLGLMDKAAFEKMKKSAIFLNLGRGPIVNEADLAQALMDGELAAAGLDVLAQEPMSEDNPLRAIKDSNKLIITPHIAWASVEARTNLMHIIYSQIEDFFAN